MAKSSQNLRQRLKKNQGLLVVVLLIIAAAGFMFYREYSIRADKQKFEQAQSNIDELYNDIVAKTGEPAKVEKVQSCGRSNQKYEQGPLRCSVWIYSAYSVSDNLQATEIAKKIHQTLNERSGKAKVTFSNEDTVLPFSILVDRQYQGVSSDYRDNLSKLKCHLTSIYAVQDSLFHVITASGPQVLSVQLGCGDSAMAEYFPLKN